MAQTWPSTLERLSIIHHDTCVSRVLTKDTVRSTSYGDGAELMSPIQRRSGASSADVDTGWSSRAPASCLATSHDSELMTWIKQLIISNCFVLLIGRSTATDKQAASSPTLNAQHRLSALSCPTSISLPVSFPFSFLFIFSLLLPPLRFAPSSLFPAI